MNEVREMERVIEQRNDVKNNNISA